MPDIEPISARQLRHELASVSGALHTLKETSALDLAEAGREILDLACEKLDRLIECMDTTSPVTE